MKKYTVDYFLRKFDAIPDDKWAVSVFTKSGKSCALGHCGVTLKNNTREGTALSSIFSNWCMLVTCVNDGRDHSIVPGLLGGARNKPKELGSTPKERIMNALILIKAWNEV